MSVDNPNLGLPFVIDSSMSKEDMARAIQTNFDHLAGMANRVQKQSDEVVIQAEAAAAEPITSEHLSEVLDSLTISQRDTATDALTVIRAGPSYVSNLIQVEDENGFVFFVVGSDGKFNTVAGIQMNGSNLWFSPFLGAADLRLVREAVKKLKLDDAAGGAADLHITGSLTVDGTMPPPPSHTHNHDTDLTGVSADDHHAEVHAIGGADHTGVITATQHGVLPDGDPHPQYARDLDADMLLAEWAFEAGQLDIGDLQCLT